MNLDDQFLRYFGSSDLAEVTPAALQGGIDHMRVDFGLEQDRERRFGLWTLLHMLGAAPDLDIAFPDAADRAAARRFIEITEHHEG
ncbi:hypothetical protein [Sphingomonas glacialis]|uniref:Uncharacterized protein n=1 Tax=Sphingomonas glacialis TaxID=658225 RepID=A0A502FX41_9SPHN|nr:hypothetical protein [Sphingomonas glacialis]TPG54065.1 hypothetical protein EAH76_05005 [Sphingomonas glacialis]